MVGQTLTQTEKRAPTVKTELLSTKASLTEDELSSKKLEKRVLLRACYYFSLLFFINVFLYVCSSPVYLIHSGVVFFLLAFNSQALNNLASSDSGPNSY